MSRVGIKQSESKWDPDVLRAVREGKALCGGCLGRKRIKVHVYGDFLGDQDMVYTRPCESCGGTGLLQGKG